MPKTTPKGQGVGVMQVQPGVSPSQGGQPKTPLRLAAPNGRLSPPVDRRRLSPGATILEWDEWPDLAALFRERSLRLLRAVGPSEWALRGGVVAIDGQPTLGARSPPARAILAAIVDHDGVFTYANNGGRRWAVAITGVEPGSPPAWTASAISGDAALIRIVIGQRPSLARRAPREHLEAGLNPRDAAAIDRRTERRQLRQQWARLETLARLLQPLMPALAEASSNETILLDAPTLACAVWGADQLAWPEEWRGRLLDAASLLSHIQCRALTLVQTGWDPHVIACSPAAHEVGWASSTTLQIDCSRLFSRFVRRVPGRALAP